MPRKMLVGALALVAILCCSSETAKAHGRFPEAGFLVFHPTDPAMIVARTSYGLLVTRDGGAEWRWICQPAVGGSIFEDPTVVITSEGDLIAGVLRGMRRGSAMGCVWEYPDPDLAGRYAIDTVRDPSDAMRLLTITSSGDVDNHVWASGDEGVSWEITSEPMPDILFDTIRIAPSDASVVYLSGAIPEDRVAMTPRQVFVSVSTDGGARFTHHPFVTVELEENVQLLGVDPADPMRLYAATVSEEDERLVVSEDGGMSFRELLVLPEVRGFAQSADGETVWVGGDRNSGLHRSDDHGERYARTATPIQILCLGLHDDGTLWACADQPLDDFTIGRSRDQGASFEPVLVSRDILGPVPCTVGEGAMCPTFWPDIAHDLGVPGFTSDAGPPLMDGGPPDGGGGDDGCGCTVPGSEGGTPSFAVVLVLAVCWVFREVSWAVASRHRR